MINYYLLMKPGIILGNLVPFAAGFLLASKGEFDLKLFCAALLGLALIMASGCVFNNYIDRPLDKKMERTKHRALVTGLISGSQAILFAVMLGALGDLLLYAYTNLLTVCMATFGFFVYVVLYSLWKSHTIYGTAIGSIAGAIPPVVGYTAVSNNLDAGALIIFAIMVLWQMPHFFAIAIYHFDDYSKAGMPLLPIKKGIIRTKIHMILYIIAFTLSALTLSYFGYVGNAYSGISIFLGLSWLALCLYGINSKNNTLWARQMFIYSLVVIMILCVTMTADVIPNTL